MNAHALALPIDDEEVLSRDDEETNENDQALARWEDDGGMIGRSE